ncbi:ABC-2 type transport system ATP-binding protein [Anaerosporobacter mobilis DSM 15930]|jgi:ABC-2 type transport system ATP-binding protein|uniref:ABC-2 type transport system ATP-binding protein n=1 Tax=Anaerosporobacter mobilis DSM 15930 TaxID=1120996 RepID=A0A1M7JKJ5_9FIRM|nr:ATP-binding cassette domain-containing protein [Anaerosporobacter mobilis]SHM53486.1 ABC-2 type transport system ATP-binding protein [Anaerosporobacter mobilis DSM 15930]
MIHVENMSKEFISPKKYPGFKGALKGLFSNEKVRKLAVDNISFAIAKGEMVGYIGSNGAGKSTSIKMMTGILTPTSGKCTVNGIVPYENRQLNAANIGVVFGQRTQLWWDLPLSETFSILKEVYNVSDEDFKNRMEFLQEVLGFDSFIHSTVRTLSLGQRMRADLAAALLHNPKVLYLDEPTIGLDLVVKDSMRQAIKEINAEYQTTVILTTHDLSDIEQLCERIIIIDEGRVIYDGTIANIKELYGKRRSVTVDVMDIQALEAIDFHEVFNLSGELLAVAKEQSSISFDFDKNVLNISHIISKVMEGTAVRDIKIQDTQITDIVKEIYKHGM